MPRQTKFSFHRAETRVAMEVPVFIDGHRRAPGAESTFTENVSVHGARVATVRHWEQDEKLNLTSRTGEFRSPARVAYCQAMRGNGFAIGLEFLEPKGRWVVQSPR